MSSSRKPFSSAEYKARVEKTRKAMKKQGMDVLIITAPANMAWLTGYNAWSFYVHQCVVLAQDGELFWFGRGIDASGVPITTDLTPEQIHTYHDHYVQSPERHPMDVLAAMLYDKGHHLSRIGVEKDSYYFTARAMESLQAGMPKAEFIDATGLVNWQRSLKSEAEIQVMRGAARVIESVYERIMEVAKPGMRQNELVAEIAHASVLGTEDYFGDYPAIVPLVGSGPESAACHLTWNDQLLPADNGVFLELTGVHHRYHTPCSRTLYFGEPPKHYRKVEAVIQEAIETTLEFFRPGFTCADAANAFFNKLHQHGYEKDNRCGYSIGLAYPPDWGEHTMSLRGDDETEFKAGMTFHFMPGLWFEDWGFETTESVLVTDSGGECLANVPRKLLVV
ncbi:MAG: M24 family metallopeptidase [Gammaproteobacteria bacterium]